MRWKIKFVRQGQADRALRNSPPFNHDRENERRRRQAEALADMVHAEPMGGDTEATEETIHDDH